MSWRNSTSFFQNEQNSLVNQDRQKDQLPQNKSVHALQQPKNPQPHDGIVSASHSQQIFSSLKTLVKQLQYRKHSNIQKFNDEALERQLDQTKTITSLNHQIFHLKQTIATQQKKIQFAQESYDKTIKQNQNKHRKQIKKYIDLLSERQTEIQNLKKTIKSLNNRALNLTNQIQMLNNNKVNLQNLVLKSIDGVKSSLKQFNYNLQQNQLDKVVLQTKYKQLCDKIEQVVRQTHQCENNKSKLEKKYEKLKESYENSRNECIQLKFQVERYKIRVKDLTDSAQGKKNKSIKQSQISINQIAKKQSQQMLPQIKTKAIEILQSIRLLNSKRESLNEFNSFRIKLDQITKQNQKLKLKLQELQVQNDNLHLKIEGGIYEDQILKSRNPSLYNLLLQKKQKIQQFESKIQQIQKVAFIAQQHLRKKLQPPQFQEIDLQNGKEDNICKAKYQQLLQQFQAEKEKAIIKQREISQKARQNYMVIINQLQQTNLVLKREVQKNKSTIQNLEKERKRLKNQIDQLIQQFQPKKKKTGKTKGKLRCSVCSKQFSNSSKTQKCSECYQKMHLECLKNHDCNQKVAEYSDSESVEYKA